MEDNLFSRQKNIHFATIAIETKFEGIVFVIDEGEGFCNGGRIFHFGTVSELVLDAVAGCHDFTSCQVDTGLCGGLDAFNTVPVIEGGSLPVHDIVEIGEALFRKGNFVLQDTPSVDRAVIIT